MKHEVDRQISLVSTVMQPLYQSVMMKNEPRSYQLKPIPSTLWVVTERMRLQIQAAEISFFCSLCSPTETVGSSVELVLHQIRVERNQLRVGATFWRHSGHILLEEKPVVDPKHVDEIIYPIRAE